MSIRYGAVLIWPEGFERDDVIESLEKIIDDLDVDYSAKGGRLIHEFDTEEGGPVWYIP